MPAGAGSRHRGSASYYSSWGDTGRADDNGSTLTMVSSTPDGQKWVQAHTRAIISQLPGGGTFRKVSRFPIHRCIGKRSKMRFAMVFG